MEHSLASSTRSRRSKASMLLLVFMGLLLCMYYSISNEGVLDSMGRSLRAPNEKSKVIEDIDSLKQCSAGERVPCIVIDEGEDGLMKKSSKAWTLLDVSSMDYFFCCRGCKKPCIIIDEGENGLVEKSSKVWTTSRRIRKPVIVIDDGEAKTEDDFQILRGQKECHSYDCLSAASSCLLRVLILT